MEEQDKVDCKHICPMVRRVKGLPQRQKVALMFISALLFYTLLLLVMNGSNFGADWVDDVTGTEINTHPDVWFYQERTSGILAGKIPYLDFYSESPPLVMYLLVPAALMGNTLLSYAVLFTGYTFLTAFLIYRLLGRVNERLAYYATLSFLFNPITWTTATIFVQDEMIVTLFYVLPVLLVLLGFGREATVAATLGAATKIFSAILIPMTLIRQKARERWQSLLLLLLLALAVIVPLSLAAGGDFILFIHYYLSQTGDLGMREGTSLWRILHDLGLDVPGILLQSLFAVSTLIMLLLVWRREIDPVRSAFLLIMPFFLFFPKVFTCYYIIPFSVLCIVGVLDYKQTLLMTLAAFLSFFIQFFNTHHDVPAYIPMEGMVALVPVLMALGVHAILIYLSWRQLTMPAHPLLQPKKSSQS